MFLDRLPGPDMLWSVRRLLDFNYIPSINSALEGDWALGDPPDELHTDAPDGETSSTAPTPSQDS